MEQQPTDEVPIESTRELGGVALSAEYERQDQPRVYVASLADYNAGRLHGVWLDANQDAEDLLAQVTDMLNGSIEEDAEEFAVHDYEGFGLLRLGEYESLKVVSKLAAGIVEHGPAFAAWAEQVGMAEATEQRAAFDEGFLGSWDSELAYAEQLADDFGWTDTLDQLPDAVRSYVSIDFELLARDLAYDVAFVPNGAGGVWAFDVRMLP